jgi:hypothetical protein
MIHLLITLIVFLLIVGCLWWCLNQVLGLLKFPPPIVVVAQVIFVLICLCAFLDYSGAFGTGFGDFHR